MKIIIIGGVAGGASSAARLRRLDENAEIIMFERGEYISFANCGLPYYIGGEIKDKSMLTLQTPESFKKRFNVDVRINSEVIEIDENSKKVTVLNNGRKYTESYDRLILSMGAKPIEPKIPGIKNEGIFTLRSIPDTYKIDSYIKENDSKEAVIIGGGYIGVEMAENLKARGLNVTIVEKADHLIAPLDFDMAADVQNYLREKGIEIILNNGLAAVTVDKKINLELDCGSLSADIVILSIGVTPDTEIAKESKISLNEKGSITVDNHMQTNIQDIYGVGDAVSVIDFVLERPAFIPLAGPANKQGRIAADNICGISSQYLGTQGSSILKIFDMCVGTTGINEKAAKQANINYDKTYIYSPSHASYYPGAKNMSIKVLWDKSTCKLLGAQIVGIGGVDKRVDVLAAAIRFGARVDELAQLELCYAPPFSSAKDPVNMIGFVAENVITDKISQFFWYDVDKLPRDGSVTLLDVRTKTEFSGGRIDGFVNIPLDELRDNLDKLPIEKPVYVHCHSGMRSYIANRILIGNGYTCFNLAGGYRLYESVVKEKKAAEYNCRICK